ncbi:MAG: hypothetical protein J6T88_03970 [Bacteroidales bacterium]|nr:hypothetical protein [Bacteroidales bacterium]
MTKRKRNGIHPVLTIAAIAAVIGILAYIVLGSDRKRDIIGTWVTDTCEVESGFRCGVQGLAASINNTTYQYNTWELSKDKLILTGKEFVGKRIYDFSDTLTIKKLSSKSLVVEQDGRTTHYKKIL